MCRSRKCVTCKQNIVADGDRNVQVLQIWTEVKYVEASRCRSGTRAQREDCRASDWRRSCQKSMHHSARATTCKIGKESEAMLNETLKQGVWRFGAFVRPGCW